MKLIQSKSYLSFCLCATMLLSTILYANDKKYELDNSYMLYSTTLPVSEADAKAGKLKLTLEKDEFDNSKQERTVELLLSPMDVKCVYNLKDDIISTIEITEKNKTVYKSNLKDEREKIFGFNSDGVWAKIPGVQIETMLKFNIVSIIDKLKLKTGDSVDLKIELQILTDFNFVYAIHFMPEITMKAYITKNAFSLKLLIADELKKTFMYKKNIIQYTTFKPDYVIGIDNDKKLIMFLDGGKIIFHYDVNGDRVYPELKSEIVK